MERGDRVGIYCTNRKEWVIVQFACYLYGLVAVPIYDTFSIESIEIVMKQTEIKILSTTADKVVSLLENSYRFPHLQRIIVLDSISDNLAKIGGSYPHIELTEIGAVETDGMSNPEPRPKDIGHDTLASINYTSGTSDLPTAVQLTHGNYLAVIAIFTFATKDASMLTLTTQDVHFSYLPMQHVLEQIVVAAMLYSGACIGFYQGDIKKIMEDLLELKPTVLVGPPRVFTKIYDGIFAKIAEKGWFATQLFKRALESKKPYVKKGYLHHSLWDALVFNKFKDALGGRVRTFLSGGAPLPSHIPFFFKSAFKANMNEGYGQTETTGALTVTTPQDFSSDSVGPPCPFLHIKLLDVPEMGYTSKDKPYPRGEICVKGPSVTSGYYRNPEKTGILYHNSRKLDGRRLAQDW
ncbi:hypothetical protein EDD86DRAFT_115029 [Gorgonomyces haynaldii]|nr:hypothetical protein EDD86DRAFT_115029 [Gorgonomyces haynaldii]